MNEPNLFTVYMHVAPNNKRYIGVTKNKVTYRWNSGKGYRTNEYFWRAIQKYGWDNFQHLIIADGLSHSEACALEKLLISRYDTTNEAFGYNLSTGGELHALGCKRTPQQRLNYSESKRGDKNPMFGKHSWNKGIPCREETKQKLRENHIGKYYGKHTQLSEEQKQHLHDINVGKIYVTHDDLDITKCIFAHELDTYIQQGYRRGYKKGRNKKKEKSK